MTVPLGELMVCPFRRSDGRCRLLRDSLKKIVDNPIEPIPGVSVVTVDQSRIDFLAYCSESQLQDRRTCLAQITQIVNSLCPCANPNQTAGALISLFSPPVYVKPAVSWCITKSLQC